MPELESIKEMALVTSYITNANKLKPYRIN